MDYLLIVVALCFISFGQILQKAASLKAAKQSSEIHFLRRIAACKETWWAVVSLVIGTFIWLAVLYRMEVSKAFPFLSFGFVLVLLASRYYFRETISPQRWAGVMAITVGVILLSRA